MTREEAAQSIYGLILSADDEDGPCIFSDQIEALEMGIEALKQPEILHCKDCKSNRNEDGTTGCDFHNFWYAADDGYCNFGQRREKNNDTGRNKSESNRGRETKKA